MEYCSPSCPSIEVLLLFTQALIVFQCSLTNFLFLNPVGFFSVGRRGQHGSSSGIKTISDFLKGNLKTMSNILQGEHVRLTPLILGCHIHAVLTYTWLVSFSLPPLSCFQFCNRYLCNGNGKISTMYLPPLHFKENLRHCHRLRSCGNT